VSREHPPRRPGRAAADGATNVKRVTVCLEDDDNAKLRQLGGSSWIRQQIRAAEVQPLVGSSKQAHPLSR
jgi:hypothetical protein